MREKHKRRREQPLSRLIPNMITLAAMCCGLSALRFAMDARWELSVSLLLAAAVLDAMDGRVARLLGATSTFGAQLDSLSDVICFGVVPAMLMYMWTLHDIRGVGWAVTLFFAICTALRLARFNSALFEKPTFDWQKKFFVGVPSPAGGLLCLLPLVLSELLDISVTLPTLIVAIYVVCVGALMVSKTPTFAGKHIRIPHDYIMPFMSGGAFLVVLLIIEPWLMMSLLGLAYLVSIYFSVRMYRNYLINAVTKVAEDHEQQ
jgi:CDP-diacylglycerol---serine O-phosphatidyltransferase